MPTKPAAGCREAWCDELTEPGSLYCRGHRSLARAPNRRSQRRRRQIRRVYTTREWRELSARKLRLNPSCELRIKCDGDPATDVDHVDEIAFGGEWLPPIEELRSACHRCHSARTVEDSLDRDHKGRFEARTRRRTR